MKNHRVCVKESIVERFQLLVPPIGTVRFESESFAVRAFQLEEKYMQFKLNAYRLIGVCQQIALPSPVTGSQA